MSFWKFLARINLSVLTTNQWVPASIRDNDVILMDYFIRQGYSGASLGLLNRCRLYLQIISLADIASADGSCIIPDVFCGIPLTDRTSTLRWPHQQRPNQKAWDLWSAALRNLQPRNRLMVHPCPAPILALVQR
jgi:hypothetical protein